MTADEAPKLLESLVSSCRQLVGAGMDQPQIVASAAASLTLLDGVECLKMPQDSRIFRAVIMHLTHQEVL